MTETEKVLFFTKDSYQQACRICFSVDNVQDLYQSKYNDVSIQTILRQFLGLSGPDLPGSICIPCIKTVIKTHIFSQQCRETANILQTAQSTLFEPNKEVLSATVVDTRTITYNSLLFLHKYTMLNDSGQVVSYAVVTTSNYNVSDEFRRNGELQSQEVLGEHDDEWMKREDLPTNVECFKTARNVRTFMRSASRNVNQASESDTDRTELSKSIHSADKPDNIRLSEKECTNDMLSSENGQSYKNLIEDRVNAYLIKRDKYFRNIKLRDQGIEKVLIDEYGNGLENAEIVPNPINVDNNCDLSFTEFLDDKLNTEPTDIKYNEIKDEIKDLEHKPPNTDYDSDDEPLKLRENTKTDTDTDEDDEENVTLHRLRAELQQAAALNVQNGGDGDEDEHDDLDYDDYAAGNSNEYYSDSDTSEKSVKMRRRRSSSSSTRNKERRNSKDKTWSCKVCDERFTKFSKYREHRKSVHPKSRDNEYVSCELCGKQLKQLCMKTHMRNVHDGKIVNSKFLCPICGKLYNSNQRRRHMMLHSTPKPYQCDHCSFKCSQQGNLRRHMRRHTGEKPYLCTVCGHGASQKGTLLEHMKSHDRLDKPVSCVFCGLEFNTNYEYRKHRRVHKNEIERPQSLNGATGDVADPLHTAHTDASLICPICKKQLLSESGFKCHVRAHKESGRYKCDICEKSFTSKATLEYHVRIHTGEKPYCCTVCPKRFKQPGHLSAHMMIHANKREHRCTFCDQTFNIKFNLIEHMRIHTGDTIDCEFCGKKFRHNSNRRKHIRENHPEKVKR